jgi:hypothetical protein
MARYRMPFAAKVALFAVWLAILLSFATSWFWLDPVPLPVPP